MALYSFSKQFRFSCLLGKILALNLLLRKLTQ